jgi:putative transposon-encoded protein
MHHGESTFHIFLEEEAHVAHHRVVAPHGSRITMRDLRLLKETYYYLEEEAHVSHQRVVASHCSSATEAPSTPLIQQK